MTVKLPYTLRTRYPAIAIAWTIILTPPIAINLALFYGLWFGMDIDRVIVLTIPTAVLGLSTVVGIIERIWKLIQVSPHFRPVKAQRYALDIFQWGYFAALLIISALISATLTNFNDLHDNHEFQIRLLSLPVSLLMYFLASLTSMSLILNWGEVRLPFRFGSMGKRSVVRPSVYYVVEDVVAVDGCGGIEFREAFGGRYEGSEVFRKMIWRLSIVWMLAFYILAGAFTLLVFSLPKDAVYAVGWAGPFPLVGALVVWTIWYVKRMLREEGAGEDERPRGASEDERAPLLDSR